MAILKFIQNGLCAVAFIVLPLSVCLFAPDIYADDNAVEATAAIENADGSAWEETPISSAYMLGVDDEIKMVVFGEPDLSGAFRIGGDGSIAVPLIGDVQIGGLSLREAESLLAAKFADGYLIDPSISLEVMTYRSFYILGEVRAPGSYSYVNNMSVLHAVALAGGFTYRANRRKVKIMKTDDETPSEYESRPVESRIMPGDIILVQERFF